MTNQQLFDTVATHLLTQRRRSMTTQNGTTRCAYRGRKDTRCAIGCLIPDDRYDAAFEGFAISKPAILKAAGLRSTQLPLAHELQEIHDMIHPSLWRGALRIVARERRLSPSVLDKE
jgi:hypothetical protein